MNEIAARPEPQAPAIAERPSTGSLLNFVAMAVSDPNIDVAKLEALLRMQREIIADESRVQFNQAYAKLMQVLPRITKKGVVEYPINKNDPDGPKRHAFNFARWEDVDAAIRPLLLEHGFSLSFDTSQRQGDGGGVVVTGELLHIGGHAKKASMALPLDTSGGKSNLQGMGSSTSFGSRYVAKMLLNLVFEGEDDDGQKGGLTFLGTEQQQQLTALLNEVKLSPQRLEGFLDHLGAAAVEGIQVKDFPMAMNLLTTEKRRQAKAAGAAP